MSAGEVAIARTSSKKTLEIAMKHQLNIAMFALATMASGVALAQSSVTLYGHIDLGYRYESSPASAKHQIANGSNNAFGFKGEEDLGGGLKAFFQLENRFQGDTGVSNTPFFDEMAVVGLRGGFGEIKLGRQGGPFGAGPDPDAFGGDRVGGRGERKAGADDKYNNGLVYSTPDFGGFSAALGTSFHESVGGRNGSSAVLKYAGGPVSVSASVASRSNRDKAWGLGAIYDFGVAKFFAAVAQNDGDVSGVERKTADLGVLVPVGNGSVRAKYNRDDINGIKTNNAGVGYWYNLSKRTMLYTNYGQEKTDGSKAINRFDIGIGHAF
jgi:predicted porin